MNSKADELKDNTLWLNNLSNNIYIQFHDYYEKWYVYYFMGVSDSICSNKEPDND